MQALWDVLNRGVRRLIESVSLSPSLDLHIYTSFFFELNKYALNDNDAAIALAQELEHRPNRTPEEDALLELLVILIEVDSSGNFSPRSRERGTTSTH
jgi:hypothetical protein